MYNYRCPQCGNIVESAASFGTVNCPKCGCNFTVQANPQQQQQPPYQQQYQQQRDVFTPGPSGKARGIAGLLAILLGSLGIHYFYLGKTTAGIVFLLLGILSCGIISILTLIQGILMLCMSEQEFENKYVYTQSSFPLF